MVTKKQYFAPDLDLEPMVLLTLLCGSDSMDGSLPDYDVVDTTIEW